MTTITPAQAKTIQEVGLFTAVNKARSFANMLTEEVPKQAKGTSKEGKKGNQTSHGAPVVRVTDLSKNAGDNVDMQIVHQLSKRPTMGDKRLEGRGESLKFSNFELKIDQGRHMVDAGGKMTQQRTSHNLRKTARTLLGPYFNNLQDQIMTVHVAGARGDFISRSHDDTIVPLELDPEFAEIMVNEVTPPTYDRHFFGGDATTFEQLDAADIFSMEAIDKLSLFLEEMSHPLQPIRYMADELSGDEPFYLLNVTPRQWNDLQQTASYKDWQKMIASALTRRSSFNHPVLKGDCLMRGNILVRKYKGMPIRFNQGSSVSICQNNNAATTTLVEAKATIDRAMLLGAQAVANAWGATESGNSFKYTEKKVDHDNDTEVSIAWMNGVKKIRWQDKAGRINDHGVIVLDTAITL
ncbi:N4-gp56 family major capsid protein [Photobacterium damselae]|uniref:N4-gp56 family major capsid protein n=1 Tax=Photobacterium damselae subsp. damselae TaxID=85581 RepID=A0AAD3WW57_PHODD|nr:N4-gp56 family major capsid protein [Photobacterium damselae]KAB1181437.1 N4-gp56 family major capsid protein [Photobacterium damselae subsp. damselae]